jgi:hypothetical protein
MAEFLVERYVSRSDAAALRAGFERARREADRMSAVGIPVRLVRSIFVPEDETCFYLYEGESIDAVLEAAGRAELRVDRIAETASSHGVELEAPVKGGE